MKLSVIIVSYNAVNFLQQCLMSLEKYAIASMEVIVWDNHSPDKSVVSLKHQFPHVHFVFHDKNLGFAKANNRAVAMAKGEYVLILNPDTQIDAGFLNQMLSFAAMHPDLGAAGVRMIDGAGHFLPESKRNLPNVFNSMAKIFNLQIQQHQSYYATNIGEREVAAVEILSGACMLLRKEVYQKVGGFDERYFMYGEDIDLSYTLLQNGYTNYYLGNVILIHYKGESTIQNKQYLKRFYGAMALFIQKYKKPESLFKYYVALIGIKMKYAIELLKLKFR